MKEDRQTKTDSCLWNEFVCGDDDAFKIIYSTQIQSLYRFGGHFTQDEDLIKDCIQDVFVDLHYYRSRLNKTDNIRSYLFVAFRRKITKQLKKNLYQRQTFNEELPFEYALSADEEEDDLNASRIKIIEKELSKLTPRQREAIYLKFVCDLSYEELEKVLNLNYQSVRNLVYLGLERLRKSCNESLVLYLLCFSPLRFKKILA